MRESKDNFGLIKYKLEDLIKKAALTQKYHMGIEEVETIQVDIAVAEFEKEIPTNLNHLPDFFKSNSFKANGYVLENNRIKAQVKL